MRRSGDRHEALQETTSPGRRRRRWTAFAWEFGLFGAKQAWACLFGGLLLALIAGTRQWWPAGAPLARYDALVLAGLALQLVLLLLRLETLREAGVILCFHVVGTAMEMFKTGTGSWHYPEASLLRIGQVPLFSGFMYSAVGSYIARIWRLFDFRFTRHPPRGALVALSALIYANFFADHWGVDGRVPLMAAAALLFGRTTVFFRVWRVHRRMPLLLGFVLVALFIWIGENVATAGGAWLYPSPARGWSAVPAGKITSRFLLMVVSYTLVSLVMPAPRPPRPASGTVRSRSAIPGSALRTSRPRARAPGGAEGG